MLATIGGLVQMRSSANQLLAARLTSELRDTLARDALTERLRGLIADRMTSEGPLPGRPAFNATPFAMTQGGSDWMVELQDVNGLIDIYFAAPTVLERVLPDAGGFLAARSALLEALPPGAWFPRIEMSLARIGVDPALGPLFTQSARSAQVRRDNAPSALAHLLATFPAGLILQGQVETVALRIGRSGPVK
jgi:hypothetical protein